jgi:hypothetical protein
MDKKIVQLMADSNYSLEQFTNEEINKVEKQITHKTNKKGDVIYYVHCKRAVQKQGIGGFQVLGNQYRLRKQRINDKNKYRTDGHGAYQFNERKASSIPYAKAESHPACPPAGSHTNTVRCDL